MLNKLFNNYFFFHFAFSCIALPCTSFMADAAKIIVSETQQTQLYSSFNALSDSSQKNTLDKDNAKEPPQTPDIKKSTSDKENIPTAKVQKPSDYFIPVPALTSPSSNKAIQLARIEPVDYDPFGIIEQIEKLILNKNSENELIHDSLIAINLAKQKLEETEKIINELAEEILSSVNPDQLIFSDQIIFQQNNTSNPLPLPKKSVAQTYKEQLNEDNISSSALDQDKGSNSELQEDKKTNSNFIKKLIHINTLFYLLALIIIFSISKRIIMYLLFGKYQKSLNN